MRVSVNDPKIAFINYISLINDDQNQAINILKNFYKKFNENEYNYVQFALNKEKVLIHILKNNYMTPQMFGNLKLSNVYKLDLLHHTNSELMFFKYSDNEHSDFISRYCNLDLNNTTKLKILNSILSIQGYDDIFISRFESNLKYAQKCLCDGEVAKLLIFKFKLSISRQLFFRIVQSNHKMVKPLLDLDQFEDDVFCDINDKNCVYNFVSYIASYKCFIPIYLYFRKKEWERTIYTNVLYDLLANKLFSDIDFIKPKLTENHYHTDMFALLFDEEILDYVIANLDMDIICKLKYEDKINNDKVELNLCHYLIMNLDKNRAPEIFDNLVVFENFLKPDIFNFIFFYFVVHKKETEIACVFLESLIDMGISVNLLTDKFKAPVWCREDSIERNVLENIIKYDKTFEFNSFIKKYYTFIGSSQIEDNTLSIEDHIGGLEIDEIHCDLVTNSLDKYKLKESVLNKVKNRRSLSILEKRCYENMDLPTTNKECNICHNLNNTFIFVPCGHHSCKQCHFKMDKCHICENKIEKLCVNYDG